jgi:hypothetical protein
MQWLNAYKGYSLVEYYNRKLTLYYIFKFFNN